MPANVDFYALGIQTAVACWEEFARGTSGAAVRRFAGVAAVIFPNEPERAFYNNAVLERGLPAGGRSDALDAMEAAYAAAQVRHFAAWVHESDDAMRRDLERRGYTFAESTRAMGLALDEVHVARPDIELGPTDWSEHLRLIGVPPDFLSRVDHAAIEVLIARLNGENVATAMTFDFGDDCGAFNFTTLERARRRGLGTGLAAAVLYRARDRGCRTATLQSTRIAEGVYAAVGFRDFGRILEYVPAGS